MGPPHRSWTGVVTGKAKPWLEAWNFLRHPMWSRGREGAGDGVNGTSVRENPQSVGLVASLCWEDGICLRSGLFWTSPDRSLASVFFALLFVT